MAFLHILCSSVSLKRISKDRNFLCGVVILVRCHLNLTDVKHDLQVRSVLGVMLNITFNLNVAARFFLITYGHDFVKRGQFQLKLYHQIYWLAWMDTVGKKMQQFSLFRPAVTLIFFIFSPQIFSPYRFFSTQIQNKNGINFDKTP